MILSNVLSAPHPAAVELLRNYSVRQKVEDKSVMSTGVLSMRIDKCLFLFRALATQEIVSDARLTMLPRKGVEFENIILKCARFACGRIIKSQVVYFVDDRESALWVRLVEKLSSAWELDKLVEMLSDEVSSCRDFIGEAWETRLH